MVLTASLQVDGFLAEIDSETAEVRAVHDRLTDRRDTAVGHSTLGSAVATGGGAFGSALALGSSAASTAGSWVGATFGGAGTLFAFLGYFKAKGPMGCFPDVPIDPPTKDQCPKLDVKKLKLPFPDLGKDSCAARGCSPTMLYRLVYPEPDYIGFHSEYDPSIKKYLLDEPARREALIQPWRDEAKELLEKEKDKEKKEELEKKAQTEPNAVLEGEEPYLFTSNKEPGKLSIDNLTARANKLADLRTVVSRMNRDLSRLTEDLATQLQCDLP